MDLKRNSLIIIFLFTTMTMACSRPEPVIPAGQEQMWIDSVSSQRIKLAEELAADQLDHRLSIEVKAKADSIVAAQSEIGRDTTGIKILNNANTVINQGEQDIETRTGKGSLLPKFKNDTSTQSR